MNSESKFGILGWIWAIALVGLMLFHLRSIKMRPVQLNLMGLHEQLVKVWDFWLDLRDSIGWVDVVSP